MSHAHAAALGAGVTAAVLALVLDWGPSGNQRRYDLALLFALVAGVAVGFAFAA